jgi:hypothetical protein
VHLQHLWVILPQPNASLRPGSGDSSKRAHVGERFQRWPEEELWDLQVPHRTMEIRRKLRLEFNYGQGWAVGRQFHAKPLVLSSA